MLSELFLILIVTFILVLFYYFFKVSQKPKVTCGNEKMRRFLKNHVPILRKTYFPSFFLWDARFHTICGLTKRKSNIRLPYRREILEMSDKGIISLDYLSAPEELADKKHMVVILPGLMNSSQTPYVKSIALAVQKANVNVVIFNFRGVGGLPLKTPRSFSADNSSDFSEVILHLKNKFPTYQILTIGTSMGGMVLSNYLANESKQARENIKSGLLLSTVYDCWSATRSIEKPGLNLKLINKNGLGLSMKNIVKWNKPYLDSVKGICDIERVLSGNTVREFDTYWTCPQFGYEDICAYYKSASIWDKIQKFPVPVFGLSALDDPMMPGQDLPFKQAQENGNFAMITTARGGHLSFLEGIFPWNRQFHFMERFVGQWIHAVVTYGIDLE